MQKTQVLKLNTSKDNIEAFFNKMKYKLSQHQANGSPTQNYDITMIVKHENKLSFKQNVNIDSINEKSLTMKSILTENNQNQKSSTSRPNKQRIYDQDMKLESRILPSEVSIKQDSSQKPKVPTQNSTSSFKVRESNKMPSVTSLFHFQKKKQEKNENNSNPKTKKSNFSVRNIDKEKKVDEEYDEDDAGSEGSDNSSQNSEAQERYEEQLKKNISRRHIDIFPNIEISGVVSQQLLSLKNVNKNQSKTIIQRRRCSITNEDLLSPRVKNMLAEQIKQQSSKQITGGFRNKNNTKSDKNLLIQADSIDQENQEPQSQKNTSTLIQTHEFPQNKLVEMEKRLTVQKQIVRKQNRQRSSALAKKSMFELQDNQKTKLHKSPTEAKITTQRDSNAIDSYSPHSKSTNHLHIEPNPSQLNQTEETESQNDDEKQSNSSNEQPQDSIYVIENKLNDCIKLLEKNQLSTLEDFLYEFKDTYSSYSNTRIQIKWRLLMAHCKENKKEFERAAVNYNHVIDLAKQNPKSLIIEPAQVYHRLGVCYSEIGWWNKGILAFTEALNRYKRCKNATKYSQCMNNLGTLYLQAESINSAQKCFIQSYNIKKSLHGKSNIKLLTSLFNIFECNLLTKNYDQAQKIIEVINDEIISQIPENQSNKVLYLGGVCRRKGKMQFLRGNLKQAQQNYLNSFDKLSNKYPYCMQFGELMSCLGLLCLEEKKYKEAKQYYDKAIMLMNFYCSKDSKTILTLKKNLEFAVKTIKEEKQGWSSKRSAN